MDDFYKEFYVTTPEEREKLEEKLKNSPEQVAACKKRLSELEILLKNDDGRCHVSRVQRDFLREVLSEY